MQLRLKVCYLSFYLSPLSLNLFQGLLQGCNRLHSLEVSEFALELWHILRSVVEFCNESGIGRQDLSVQSFHLPLLHALGAYIPYVYSRTSI
jgi:hypothetical protein